MERLIKVGVAMVGILIVPLFGWLIYRGMFYTWVENYQFGYTYNYWTGEQAPTKHKGYVYMPPFTGSVHTIDLRPMQVCISSIQRVLNCKLVHFESEAVDPETKLKGWELFIKWHGRNDYEGAGTTNTGNLREILTNYAYDGTGRSYPFLFIEKELKGDGVIIPQTTATAPKPPETKR